MSATLTTIPKLIALGYDVVVEEGAGDESSFPNAEYAGSGAVIVLEASRYGRIISFAMTQSKGAQDG